MCFARLMCVHLALLPLSVVLLHGVVSWDRVTPVNDRKAKPSNYCSKTGQLFDFSLVVCTNYIFPFPQIIPYVWTFINPQFSNSLVEEVALLNCKNCRNYQLTIFI